VIESRDEQYGPRPEKHPAGKGKRRLEAVFFFNAPWSTQLASYFFEDPDDLPMNLVPVSGIQSCRRKQERFI